MSHDEMNVARAVDGAMRLRAAMRNPDSFKLGMVRVMDDDSICYGYRAQNGFGGMDVGNAVLTAKGQFESNEMDGFTSLWHRECVGKTGRDRTSDVISFVGQ